jgi:hypothetical protein
MVTQALGGLLGGLVGGKLGEKMGAGLGRVAVWTGRAVGWVLGGGLFNALQQTGRPTRPEVLQISRVNGAALTQQLYAALESAQAAVRAHEQSAVAPPPPAPPKEMLSFLQRVAGALRLENTSRLVQVARDHLDEVLDALQLHAEDYSLADEAAARRNFAPQNGHDVTAPVTLLPALFHADKLVLQGRVILPARRTA